MRLADLMNVALKAGEIMLRSGAEIYRVEETIVRICESYEVQCESFVLPTGIFISLADGEGGTNTAFRRIRDRKVDLTGIDRVNSLSRRIQKTRPDFGIVLRELKEIENTAKHGFPVRLTATGLGSFAFTLHFNGSLYDSLAALVIGCISYSAREILTRKGLFLFLENLLAGLITGFLSTAAVDLFPELDGYRIIIGSVLMYLPGVSITNSIKDALYGDLVASTTRLAEAILLVTVLAAGIGVALVICANRR
ncbi:MAG TPA: threonine/serine exporter family protein [Clostridiales bacterium]|nr:threonine/serine exporter family protein [Clostridiales bacterium]HPV02066.1 threonine/serine exporter family protein [Clostridiales bacterium]